MIYIIGDTHIPIDFKKLEEIEDLQIQYVIVAGDFGLLWKGVEDEEETFYKNILERKNFITLFIKGNHENHFRLQKLPKVNMFGAIVAQISDKIYQLLDGEVYTIENNTFFTLGGAESTDKLHRIPYLSWWPEEIPSYRDYQISLRNLSRFNYEIDYVISHTAPVSIVKRIINEDSSRIKDSTTEMLEEIKNRISFKKWFFGHFHKDLEIDDFICTMEKGHYIKEKNCVGNI